MLHRVRRTYFVKVLVLCRRVPLKRKHTRRSVARITTRRTKLDRDFNRVASALKAERTSFALPFAVHQCSDNTYALCNRSLAVAVRAPPCGSLRLSFLERAIPPARRNLNSLELAANQTSGHSGSWARAPPSPSKQCHTSNNRACAPRRGARVQRVICKVQATEETRERLRFGSGEVLALADDLGNSKRVPQEQARRDDAD